MDYQLVLAAVTAAIRADDGYQGDGVAAPSAALALCARWGPQAYGLVLSDAVIQERAQASTGFDRCGPSRRPVW